MSAITPEETLRRHIDLWRAYVHPEANPTEIELWGAVRTVVDHLPALLAELEAAREDYRGVVGCLEVDILDLKQQLEAARSRGAPKSEREEDNRLWHAHKILDEADRGHHDPDGSECILARATIRLTEQLEAARRERDEALRMVTIAKTNPSEAAEWYAEECRGESDLMRKAAREQQERLEQVLKERDEALAALKLYDEPPENLPPLTPDQEIQHAALREVVVDPDLVPRLRTGLAAARAEADDLRRMDGFIRELMAQETGSPWNGHMADAATVLAHRLKTARAEVEAMRADWLQWTKCVDHGPTCPLGPCQDPSGVELFCSCGLGAARARWEKPNG